MSDSTHDESAIKDRVIGYILEASDEEVAASDVGRATTLRADLDLSSMQAITMVMDLEDEFEITVEDDEIEKLVTVGDVLDLIARKRDC